MANESNVLRIRHNDFYLLNFNEVPGSDAVTYFMPRISPTFFKLGCLLFLLLNLGVAQATLPLRGYLIADKTCPGLHSIKKQTNPDEIFLQSGSRYRVTGQNKAAATYYQVLIEGIKTPQRWVEVSCGKFVKECPDCSISAEPPSENTGKDYVLAVSWQAGFCQSHRQKAECKTQTAERFDAMNLTLHGLWPQPQDNAYCGVNQTNTAIDRNKHWNLLPPVDLNPAVAATLAEAMPGMLSNLDRHEWIKHGTCYGGIPDEYFQEALNLLKQINASSVRELFVNNIGKKLTADDIRAAFNQAFPGSGAKVNIKCSSNLITELWLNLRGDITINTALSDLLRNAPNANLSCKTGKVDTVGF